MILKKKFSKIKAPNFKIESTSRDIIDLKKLKSKFVVIYFYPKNDTPGCTLETKDFNSLLPEFKKLNCLVLGISKDSLKSHLKFKKNIKSNLISCPMKKK